jgi:predicted glycosyltransferase
VPDPEFAKTLLGLGIESKDVLVVIRPPAREALYHRFENELFDDLLTSLNRRDDVKIILLPRSDVQRAEYEARKLARLIMPRTALDGANLIAAADLVVSAGGTMNREAAALGVPAVSIYAGKWAAIDQELVEEGRLRSIGSVVEIETLVVEKKHPANPRAARTVRAEVVKLILE